MLRVGVTVPVDIPDVEVIRTKITKASVLIITLESTRKGTTYQRCGRRIHKFHGYGDRLTVRRLPVFGRATRLRYCPKRCQCQFFVENPETTECLD